MFLILKYLKYTYFGKFNKNQSKSPIFEIVIWSVYERIKENNPRAVKRNKWFKQAKKISNPNMPLFINSIFKIELKIKLKLNNPFVETFSFLKKIFF